jgi:hypothetical protein
MTGHPSSKELYDALLRTSEATDVYAHIEACLACRVRMARIEQSHNPQPPSSNTVQRIIDASTVVPGVVGLSTLQEDQEPKHGQLWRIGRNEALLAWVRKIFDDGAVDVIPVVLDVELADEQTIIVPSSAAPLPVELAAMVALRTHVHRDAFINRLGELDISANVEDVIAATREGRPSLATVGPSIDEDDDERIEYRQALRDLLAELSPSAWSPLLSDPGEADPLRKVPNSGGLQRTSEAEIQAAIPERLLAARCMQLDRASFSVVPGIELKALFKVVFLDTAVVVTGVASLDDAAAGIPQLVAACQRAADSSPDADAICVVEPDDDWKCLLFTRASMRQALELPAGIQVGPTPILSGLGLIDTLWKHLEGAAPAWEVTESPPRGIGAVNVMAIADRHAQASINSIQGQGRRAHQAAKKSSWTALPAELSANVARFVAAVTREIPLHVALADLDRENRRD